MLITGGPCERLVEREVLGDGGFARRNSSIDGGKTALDRLDRRCVGAHRRQSRDLDLDRKPQLHHRKHVLDRGHAVGINAKRDARRVMGDKRTGALACYNETIRPQRRNGFTNDRPADTHGIHEFPFGRQARTRREFAARNQGSYALGYFGGTVALWCEGRK